MKRVFTMVLVMIALAVLPLPVSAAGLQVAGKSSVLMDLETGTVLQEHNAHEALAPASVTKIMTMLLIMEAVDSGKITMTDMVTASETAAAKGGSQIYLKAGETMTVSDMLKSITVSSANDCACAMAEHLAGSEAAFVEQMNAKAAQLGMQSTHFVNCTGLDDDPNAAQHRTSAYDIALMSRELMKNHPDIKKFTTIWMDTVRNGTFGLSNTNKLVRFYQGATGLKTGYTSGAGYCLSATAQREGMELIAVVMGADTSANRNTACKQLLDYGFANYAVIRPELENPEPVPVNLGKQGTVEATLGETQGILLDKAQKGSVTMELSVEKQVDAPVSQGQRLGTLTVKAGDQVLRELPLVATEAVPRLNFWDLWGKVLGKTAMGK